MSLLKDKPLKKCHTDKRKMIDDLHKSLIKDMDIKDKNEYYLDNGILLNNYYMNNNSNQTTITSNGILSYFNDKDKNEKTIDSEDKTRKHIVNTYMSNIDDNIESSKFKTDIQDKCKTCSEKYYFSEKSSELICIHCGYTEDILVITDKNSYNDSPHEICYFAYKRINHFNEWLAQFQAKEKIELPEDIYKEVNAELRKNIYFDVQKLNDKMVRDILKKLKYNKYYEHIPHIINVIGGEKAPTLNRKSEEMLRSLFKEIQIPFMNNCPSSRKNFLSYSYVLHKFCELLEYDHLLENFPLLKSREKLQQQDIIWKNICSDLNWQFIPSI